MRVAFFNHVIGPHLRTHNRVILAVMAAFVDNDMLPLNDDQVRALLDNVRTIPGVERVDYADGELVAQAEVSGELANVRSGGLARVGCAVVGLEFFREVLLGKSVDDIAKREIRKVMQPFVDAKLDISKVKRDADGNPVLYPDDAFPELNPGDTFYYKGKHRHAVEAGPCKVERVSGVWVEHWKTTNRTRPTRISTHRSCITRIIREGKLVWRIV